MPDDWLKWMSTTESRLNKVLSATADIFVSVGSSLLVNDLFGDMWATGSLKKYPRKPKKVPEEVKKSTGGHERIPYVTFGGQEIILDPTG